MTPLAIPLIDAGLRLIERLIPDKQKAAEAKLKLVEMQQQGELKAMEAELAMAAGQLEINKVEAASGSVFVAGWRPAVGWICVGGLAYQIIVRPLAGWLGAELGGWAMPPELEMDTLMTLLLGMLGLGGLRTVEKMRGVARQAI